MNEDMEALYEASFTLIGIAGDSKAESMEAINCAKKGDFEGARSHLAAADETMVKAHDAQTEMLQQEAEGNPVKVNIILVHGTDASGPQATYVAAYANNMLYGYTPV